MTEQLQDDLQYGHLGDLRYDRESGSWETQRNPVTQSAWNLIDESRRGEPDTPLETLHRPKAHKRKAITREIIERYPTLQPASAIISDYLVEAVQADVEDAFDGLDGNQIVIANASVTIHGKHPRIRSSRRFPILLSPGGSRGDELRLFQLKSARYGWDQEQSKWTETLHLPYVECGRWTGAGDKIRQITHSDSPGPSADLIAIRTATSIKIIDLVKQDMSIASIHRYRHLSASPVAVVPNHILNLERLGGSQAELADCRFDPHDARQLAAIDALGSWIVWRLIMGPVSRAELLARGFMRSLGTQRSENEDDASPYDGWHRILWLSKPHALVAADRVQLQVYNFQGRTLANWHLPSFYPSERIRDGRASPFDDDCLFLVTSRRIVLICLTDAERNATLQVLGSWEHHQDRLDRSLTMAFIAAARGGSVALHSRYHSLVTEFQLAKQHDQPRIISSMNPTRIDLHVDGVRGLWLREWSPNIPTEDEADGGATSQEPSQVPLLQMICLTPELQPVSMIFRVMDTDADIHTAEGGNSRWRKVVSNKFYLSENRVKDDFVIDDDADSSEDDLVLTTASDLGRRTSRLDSTMAFSVPNQLIYSKILDSPNGNAKDTDLADLFVTFSQLLGDYASVNSIHLISDVLPHHFKIADLEKTSNGAALLISESTISQLDPTSTTNVQPLADSSVLGMGSLAINMTSIDSIYSRLVSTWLRPLSASVPTKVRLVWEKHVRQIAASLFLASHGVRIFVDGDAARSASQDLRAEEAQPGDDSDLGHPIPPPETSTTHLPIEVIPAAERLRHYAVINNPPQSTPKATSKIVAHWKLQEDPAMYDYAATSAEVEGTSQITGSSLSAADQERVERRRDRRKQRLEASLSRKRARFIAQAAQIQSQPPGRGWSDPQPSNAAIAIDSQLLHGAFDSTQRTSSKTELEPAAIATQVEPGRWGGRQFPLRNRPLRPRKAGF